jgi:hypothetical protein
MLISKPGQFIHSVLYFKNCSYDLQINEFVYLCSPNLNKSSGAVQSYMCKTAYTPP